MLSNALIRGDNQTPSTKTTIPANKLIAKAIHRSRVGPAPSAFCIW
jgi:hypothetical protein